MASPEISAYNQQGGRCWCLPERMMKREFTSFHSGKYGQDGSLPCMGRGGEGMKSFSEIKNQILKLRLMFEKDKAVDSRMWEKVVEAIDEGQLKGWLSSPNAQNLKEELSELEQELKALENF